ncbi:protein OS-9-like [Clytia hemisphaerica]|uniref:MRH domain-containing protein n=1 Tax=Clytia hemisphaerica TaxID=252671 RepID=A0A7M5UYC9_9CNID
MLTLCLVLSLFGNFLPTVSSYLNVDEITNLKYGVEISDKPVLFQGNSFYQSPDVMTISSKFGQKYSCNLPVLQLPETEDDNEDKKIDPMTIISTIDKSLNDTCLEFNKGWWTYKLCHKKNITQYHVTEQGEVDSKTTELGAYEKEDDWKDKNLDDKKTKHLYHKADYINGSKCDLTSIYRSTVVQYYCSDENLNSNMVIRVEEPATCEYIISVHVKKLCTHPAFEVKEKTKKVTLTCSPILGEKAFKRYQEEQKFIKEENDRKKKAAMEKFAKEKEEALKRRSGNFFKLDDTIDTGSDMEFLPVTSESIFEEDEGLKLVGDMLKKTKEIFNPPEEVEDKKENVAGKDASVGSASKLDKTNKKLFDFIGKQRTQLTKQFEDLRSSTMKEMARSKSMLKTLRTVKKIGQKTGDTDEDGELDSSIKSLEEGIEKFQKQIDSIDDKMQHVTEMEKRTEKALDKMNARLKRQENIRKRLDETFKSPNEGKDSENAEEEKKEDYSFIKFPHHPDQEEREEMIKALPKHLRDIMQSFEEKKKQQNHENKEDRQNENHEKLKNKRAKKSISMEDILSGNEEEEKEEGVEAMKKLKNVAEDLDEENSDFTDFYERITHKEDVFNRNKRESSEQDIEKEIAEQRKKDLKVRVRTINKQEADKLETNHDMDEKTEMRARELEEKVKKQLESLGLDVKNKIKIKVITSKDEYNKMSKGEELMSTDQLNDVKDMFYDILGGSQEKKKEEQRQQSLEESYMKKWNENENDDE